ncbi:MAG TPA: glycosyltransferase family 39 protein [Solirubrobacteraceae bacterium]|jgi:4-amino-4-deoxy-L-arabinose transferase-like glycosyltransferase
MAFLRHLYEPQPAGPAGARLGAQRRAGGDRVLGRAVAAVRRAPELGGLIAIAALLNLWALGRNGWANTYYSGAVRSMASSWHSFLYASLDPSGVMTVDKPPLSLWVQALSVRIFGFHQLAILVPQALIGVASVVLVYDLVRRPFGRIGGLVAGLVLATTPIAVAMSRDNNPDALLTLCCLAAVWFAVRGFEHGRTRWLVFSGVAVGLGFETKMLVALVVVPGIALAWLWISPRGRGWRDAFVQLLYGGAAMLVVGGAWPLLVALTPAGSRPWISGTSDNSVLSLIFGYNGFGRVDGQQGGPGGGLGGGGGVFAQATGPFRLLNASLGGQAGWLLGLALAGALIVLIAARVRRRDPRTAWVAVVAGAFVVTAVLFSFAHGIFHPYYVVLLAPFTAALVGAGVATVIRGGVRVALAGPLALALGVACELVVRSDYSGHLEWMPIVLPLVCGAAALPLIASSSRRLQAVAMGVGVAALLVAPAAFAVDTLGYATNATFPAGGPQWANSAASPFGAFGVRFGFRGGFGGRAFAGAPPRSGSPVPLFGGNGGSGPAGGSRVGAFPRGGVGFSGPRAGGAGGGGFGQQVPDSVLSYATEHGGGTVATEAQSGAALNIIDQNADVAGIGGFSGSESDPSISWLAGEVASGHIRWIYVEGPSADAAGRAGATAAIAAAEQACPAVSGEADLYDCAGKAGALRAAA